MSDPEASRPFIEAASPEHPSLLDPTHQLDSLFGVVNIPNVFWIDEDGVIVRPPEPGFPPGDHYPEWLRSFLDERDEAAEKRAAEIESSDPDKAAKIRGGQDQAGYADAIRDWADNGAESQFVLSPDEVIARSQDRSPGKSEGAAHFELANHFWRNDQRDAAIPHFNAAHRLQPENWTYKRQAWSALGNEQAGGGEMGRFNQGPLPGEEADWPFDGTFAGDAGSTPAGDYYPKTL